MDVELNERGLTDLFFLYVRISIKLLHSRSFHTAKIFRYRKNYVNDLANQFLKLNNKP